MSSIDALFDALFFVAVAVATAGGVFTLVTEMVAFGADAGAATRADVAVTRADVAPALPAAKTVTRVAPIQIRLR